MSVTPDACAARDERRWLELTLIFAGFGLYFFVLPHSFEGDDWTRFHALRHLLEGQGLASTRYSLLGPLFSTPLYLLGKLFFGPEWWLKRYGVLLLAMGAFTLFRILRHETEPRLLRRLMLVLLAGSLFPNALRFYGGETFTAISIALGVVLLPRRPIVGSCFLVLGSVNTPAVALGTTLVVFRQAIDTKRWRYFLVPLAAAGLILLEAQVRRSGWLVTGYEGDRGVRTLLPFSGLPGFSYPFLFGLLSLVLSFGKGLLFFTPGLFLRMPDDERQALSPWRSFHAMSVWFVVGLLLVYSKWWAWYGGWAWGPRFFLFASFPAALTLVSRLERRTDRRGARLLTLIALALSTWVGVNGAVYGLAGLDLCEANTFALESLCWYVPEFSPLWHPFVAPLAFPVTQLPIVLYAGIVLVYLAAPLGVSLVEDTFHAAVAATRRHLLTVEWRF